MKTFSRYILFSSSLFLATVILLISPVATPVQAIQKDEVRLKAILTQDQNQQHLAYPTSVFFDQDADEVYVVDAGNNQLVLFDCNGYPTAAVGKGRSLNNIVSGMHYRNKLYVCCSGDRDFPLGNITILDNAFFPRQQLVLAGKFPDKKNFITREVMAGRNGAFYVLQSNNSDISIFDSNWNFLRHITPHYKHLGIREPATIADMTQDQNGIMYFLSEQWGRVFVYDENEEFLFSFGEKGGDRGKLARARGIAVDSNNERIYIVDYLRHTILVYNMEGQWLYEIGSKGTRPGYFFYPSAVCIDNNGILYVADTFNHRVQIFSIRQQKNS